MFPKNYQFTPNILYKSQNNDREYYVSTKKIRPGGQPVYMTPSQNAIEVVFLFQLQCLIVYFFMPVFLGQIFYCDAILVYLGSQIFSVQVRFLVAYDKYLEIISILLWFSVEYNQIFFISANTIFGALLIDPVKFVCDLKNYQNFYTSIYQ